MIRCLDEIAEQIRRSLGLSMTAAQIKHILNGGTGMDEQAQKIIHKEAGAYTRRLLSAIAESGLDARAMPAIFLGGGANETARSGRRWLLPAPDPGRRMPNAKGYERLVEQLLARNSHG